MVFGSRSRTSPSRFGFGAETDFRPALSEFAESPSGCQRRFGLLSPPHKVPLAPTSELFAQPPRCSLPRPRRPSRNNRRHQPRARKAEQAKGGRHPTHGKPTETDQLADPSATIRSGIRARIAAGGLLIAGAGKVAAPCPRANVPAEVWRHKRRTRPDGKSLIRLDSRMGVDPKLR